MRDSRLKNNYILKPIDWHCTPTLLFQGESAGAQWVNKLYLCVGQETITNLGPYLYWKIWHNTQFVLGTCRHLGGLRHSPPQARAAIVSVVLFLWMPYVPGNVQHHYFPLFQIYCLHLSINQPENRIILLLVNTNLKSGMNPRGRGIFQQGPHFSMGTENYF